MEVVIESQTGWGTDTKKGKKRIKLVMPVPLGSVPLRNSGREQRASLELTWT